MLTPTLFFLFVVNLVYGLFETFAVVDATTKGGPAGATTILVYKVYLDGFVSLDLGSSAAQSLILMTLALMLTFVQFRFIERRVELRRSAMVERTPVLESPPRHLILIAGGSSSACRSTSSSSRARSPSSRCSPCRCRGCPATSFFANIADRLAEGEISAGCF